MHIFFISFLLRKKKARNCCFFVKTEKFVSEIYKILKLYYY